ncbi:MAG: LysR family transcriptional regulator, partial [Synergistaceae bacterium]|nr:LysR family transcriptional regulator [Synergistaceae bacterium]
MEIRVLRYFLEAAREGNITRAAACLHVSQPTVTRQLHQMEEELGVKLFIRGSVNIRLTREGLLLKERAQEIVDLEEKTRTDLSSVRNDISGTVCIGAGETAGVRFIGSVLKKLRDRYPDVRYRMISGDMEGVAEKLDKGLTDFGVFIGKTELARYDCLTLPDVDTWGMIVREDDPLAKQGFVRPADLPGRPLLFSHQAKEKGDLEDWLGYPVERLDIIGTHNLTYNASVMVRHGLGAALSLEGLVNTTGNTPLRFVPLKPKITARIVLAWR